MRRQRKGIKLLALILGLSLVAAACGGDDDDDSGGGGGGNELVLAMEQEGATMDWISSDAGTSWAYWTVGSQTMPRSFDVVQEGEGWAWEASDLLDGDPEIVLPTEAPDGKQQVTYKIAADRAWDDGTEITCTDYKYTWDQVKNGEAIYDQTGYSAIESVECPDEAGQNKTVVAKFAEPYAAWKKLFGGQYGIYPAHLLEGKDRHAEMNEGYTFSAGPWKLDHWTPGQEVVLVPNDKYWGDVPKIEKVTFKLIEDTPSETEAFKGGEVDGFFPQPQPDVIAALEGGLTGAKDYIQQTSPNIEGLWINNTAFPFDSQAVRQAFAYSLDRDALVKRLFGGVDVTEAQNTFNPKILGDFGDPDAFADYQRDLDKVDSLMEGDGWTKGSDGIWEKNGQKASFALKTTAGNLRREQTQDIVIEQAKEAGFEVRKDENQKADDLFGTQVPQGDYVMALYAQVLTEVEPNLNTLFNSANIPTEANPSGQNWQRVDNPELDPLLTEIDANPVLEDRSKAAAEAEKTMAEQVVSIPLDPLPNILILSDRIKMDGDAENNPIYGPFDDMNLWSL